MKHIDFFLLLMTIVFFVSCSEKDALLNGNPNVNGKFYTISLSLGGEFHVSEEPLTRMDMEKNRVYAINVCYRKSPTDYWEYYAYGLFDNPKAMNISLFSSYRYKFECSIVEDARDKLAYEIDGNEKKYGAPFYLIYKNWQEKTLLSNKFIINKNSFGYFDQIKSGTADLADGSISSSTWPAVDRYYGILEDFIPSKGGKAIIKMSRTAFGVQINLAKPIDGTIIFWGDLFDKPIELKATDTDFQHESVHTFRNVWDCWKQDDYSENIAFNLRWTRQNESMQEFSKEITVKRNVKTIIDININSATKDLTLGVDIENVPMKEEHIKWEIITDKN